MPVERRGTAVYDLLMAERLTAIPLGMWSGLFLSLLLSVVLGVAGTAVAGPFVRQNGRRWVLLLRYFEIVLPGAVATGQLLLLGILGLFATTRMNLPWWHPPVVLAASALAVVAALRRWPWFLRLPLLVFLAAVVLTSRYFDFAVDDGRPTGG